MNNKPAQRDLQLILDHEIVGDIYELGLCEGGFGGKQL